jgi:phage protein D
VTGRREAPGVRITLLSNERAPSGERLDLDGRILGFSFEDSVKKADKVTLQLDNFDLSLFERSELVSGAIVEVCWGYPGNMSAPRRVVLKKFKGFEVLSFEGQATSVLLNQQARTRAWKGKTRSDVARAIAAEHGFTDPTLDIEETLVPLDTINQVGETDARFLKRLAARDAFDFFVDDRGFHWRSRDPSTPPTHVLTWFSDPGRGDILSISVESDLTRRVGRVDVKGRDPLTKSNLSSSSANSNVDRPTLGTVVEVVDPRTGSTSLQQRNATATIQPSAGADAASAERESAARFRKAERDTLKLSVQVVGDPSLRAKTVIELRGISSLLSGKYYVTEAKHAISSSGYVVDLKLTRDAGGPRGAAAAANAGQAQSGQPNRNEAATGGALTPVEVIDHRTGTARVEYRRNGQSIGSSDPEARVIKPL